MTLETPGSARFSTQTTLKAGGREYAIWSLAKLPQEEQENVARLPYSLRILLENLLRHDDGSELSRRSIEALLHWNPLAVPDTEIWFTPARVLLQDFTGVPCVVDLAAMRDAMETLGGDPSRINPLQRVDLVIDHSIVVDTFGTPGAFADNAALEYERNRERYAFLRWGSSAFRNFSVVPPDTGIVHQVNLECLASVVFEREQDGVWTAYPDTLVGTDSHTPMVNGLGVVGWGVGGIEAEAAMLGQPISMLIPQVVGVRLSGKLPAGATATDLVLTITQMLRKHGVVGRFVEYFGPGVSDLPVADRATLANMSPEYGATIGYFPIDAKTIEYLRLTARSEAVVERVEAYAKHQGLFRTDDSPAPTYSAVLELDLGTIEPCMAGPKRPQDRVTLANSRNAFREALAGVLEAREPAASVRVEDASQTYELKHGSVVIAAITSCTNTSNPPVLIAAGLLAKKAVERGLKPKPWVKTSLSPGSKVVSEYLAEAGLTPYLDKLGFHLTGYGCMTCIGNSGPLPEPVANAITGADLVAAAVLSGNRNFEGRVNPLVRANYLASPPLVVAYALAGTMDIDLTTEPLGTDTTGKPVFLADVWPTPKEIDEAISKAVRSELFRKEYEKVFEGDRAWQELPTPKGNRFAWEPASTYIRRPPFFEGLPRDPQPMQDIAGARVLAMLGNSVTTDHISPAGTIAKNSPAARYLIENGVEIKDFNSYGSRRGNHEVLMRGTFANIRLRNQLAPGTEGGWTVHLPEREVTTIYDAAMRYKADGVPLVILAGQEYGSGSSRDWAAKGPALLNVRAVIAESYERIHRSNLVGMGILPLQFEEGQDRVKLGLTGFETYEILGIAEGLTPGKRLPIRATDDKGAIIEFTALARIDTPNEVEYFRHGGILPYVLRQLLAK